MNKKIILKLILATILLIIVIGIIVFMNSKSKLSNSQNEKINNNITESLDKADQLIDRNMIIQITEKDAKETNTYNIYLSDDGILFKYLDTNQKTTNVYDRYTIIAEKKLNYVQRKSLEDGINKLEQKDNSNSQKTYTIMYAGEEKTVDGTELNNLLSVYEITF